MVQTTGDSFARLKEREEPNQTQMCNSGFKG